MPGEVVYDSILENKQKTKIFWEQLMLAANIGSDATPLSFSRINHQINSNTTDVSDQEFYDAQPYTPPEVTDSPKIVEVSKKPVRAVDSRVGTQTEDIETEIKAQSEKESGSGDDQERVLKTKSQAESKIVLEMREMKEREDEWRRQQMAYIGTAQSLKEDEAFISIPTTDEGNYSEYGSEPSLNGINRIPEVSPNQNISTLGFQHHRTQSLDSMSSGHSSGSGSVAQLDHLPVVNRTSRRGITVKPLDEPEEDVSTTFIWREKETPIEREIRLVREREEELRREKAGSLPVKEAVTPVPVVHKESLTTADGKTNIETPKRLATKRIEYEIEQAKMREKELKKDNVEEEIQSNNEVLKPLTDKTEIKSSDVSDLKQNKTTPVNSTKILTKSASTPVSAEPKEVGNNFQNRSYSSGNNVETMPKRFQPNPNQKGLMKRFLASRGKISSAFTFSTFSASNAQPSHSPVMAPTPVLHQTTVDAFVKNKVSISGEDLYEKTEPSKPENLGSRPGYTSAEDKIQFELMEMRKREEELRKERARLFARSQPDLLSIVDDEQEAEQKEEEEEHHHKNKLPPMAKLRSALSNPSLVDIDKQPPIQRKQKRRSALIEEWEDRIQKSHNNE